MRIEFAAAAERELDEVVSYFEARRPGLGLAFAAEVASAVARIEQYPNARQSLSGGTRRCLLRKFEYGLVYQVRGDVATVYAVMHLRRRPTYWRSRLDTK
ncbi:type II toxin-antitoxin system RelE/ParE family toxin [Hyphomicrobium sp.]|uniref:type II toxin-antitoxin system RelE/ParE family toxin n=1 Tax=Hyphomicrobium sp. TaxID=82 RepID=UPI0025BBBBBD|nr:type II toxin-antitoxin system RelE/ParE family toxin [Hyphomicrobium sp.]MCC7250661.1 type II toxin-antitoxin system RelE/ParE family toxin [Hyphomicrobium sp.]